MLDHQKNKWLNIILPKNMVQDDLKNIVNNKFSDLYVWLDSDERPKTAESLREIQLEQNELSDHLVLAYIVSDIPVVVHM
jgi:hypothetical protein